ncbi:MAG: hypothetical protein WEA77_01105 [Hyphomonas sp.]|uniref:hypothetical protein n=1 Tax=Hyphomonas sp. TaxID=87 RepID=UPI00349FEE5D
MVIEPAQCDRRLIHVYRRGEPARALPGNLQSYLEKGTDWRVTVASLPKLPAPKDEKKAARSPSTREEL